MNPGFSFPVVNLPQRQCLSELQNRYLLNGKTAPIPTLEIGPGHGLTSWKLIASGGQLVAVEREERVVPPWKETLNKARQFLPTGAPLGAKVLRQDILTLSSQQLIETIKKPFEIVWMSNVLHFFSPGQSKQLAELLFKAMQKDGKAFITVISVPKQHAAIWDTYRKAKASGSPFPGYLMTDVTFTMGMDFVQSRIENKVYAIPATEEYVPGVNLKGWYREPLKKDGFTAGKANVYRHIPAHFFDTETLSALFANAGFAVESAYYFSESSGQRVASLEDGTDDVHAAIIVRKP